MRGARVKLRLFVVASEMVAQFQCVSMQSNCKGNKVSTNHKSYKIDLKIWLK